MNAAAGYNAVLYVHGLSGVREVLRNVNSRFMMAWMFVGFVFF